MNPIWAVQLRPAVGPEIVIVLEVPIEPEIPPVVHNAISVARAPDRYLAALGWQVVAWQPRSYGAVTRLRHRHPHS